MRPILFIVQLLVIASTSMAQGDAGALYAEAIEARKKGDLIASVGKLRQAIALKPDYTQAWFDLGFVHNQLGRFGEAIPSLKKAAALGLRHPRLQYELGTAFLRTDSARAARIAFNEAIALRENYVPALIGLGNVEKDLLKNPPAALFFYQKAIALEPQNALAQYLAGWCYNEAKDWGRAITHLQTSIALDSAYAPAWADLGYAHYQRAAYSEAETALLHSIQLEPNGDIAYFYLGMSYVKEGKKGAAVKAYNKLVLLKSSYSPELLVHLKSMSNDATASSPLF